MKTRCLIVDDEPLAIEVIENHIGQFENMEIVATCRNAIQALEILEKVQIDLIFLDIQMPKLTGIDFLKAINNPPKVIFTTAYIDHAIEGYELDVVDYLIKPISFQRFIKAINKYFERTNSEPRSGHHLRQNDVSEKDYIFVKSERKKHKLLFSDIRYIESIKDYIKIYSKEKRLIVKHSLTSFEDELPAGKFLRIHRSYIVNLDFITAYTAYDIEINSVELPIGISYKQKVFEILE
jgi:DNA-binding LytR/AlgR family response regulator